MPEEKRSIRCRAQKGKVLPSVRSSPCLRVSMLKKGDESLAARGYGWRGLEQCDNFPLRRFLLYAIAINKEEPRLCRIFLTLHPKSKSLNFSKRGALETTRRSIA